MNENGLFVEQNIIFVRDPIREKTVALYARDGDFVLQLKVQWSASQEPFSKVSELRLHLGVGGRELKDYERVDQKRFREEFHLLIVDYPLVNPNKKRKHPDSPTEYPLHINTFKGGRVTLEVADGTSVSAIKYMFAIKECVKQEHLRLLFNGKELRDSQTVNMSEIVKNATLQMIFRE